jgi:hypothetical protein
MLKLLRIALLGLTASSLVFAGNEDLLDQGFEDMYNLSFEQAHAAFGSWEKAHPDDPRGPAFNAAAYLFSEFDRLRILQSELFVDDSSFFSRKRLTPDPHVKKQFEAELARSQRLADDILRRSPDDKNALHATVTRLGLHADYLALIQKQDLAALSDVKLGRQIARRLLQLYPSEFDAYLASGVENYLLSQKAAPVRWLLHLGGAQTDKAAGIADLRIVASKGRFLQPYAKLLLAVAALRDGNKTEARRLLRDLAAHFPGNRLYREELKKMDG